MPRQRVRTVTCAGLLRWCYQLSRRKPCPPSQTSSSLVSTCRLFWPLPYLACRPVAAPLHFELKLSPSHWLEVINALLCVGALLFSFLGKSSMTFSIAPKLIAACAIIYWPVASFSHIVLENKSAPTGSNYKAVFQVGHGCNGAPTTAIAVQIPPGFEGVKPFAKAGWTITSQGNTAVTWTAASKEAALPDAHVDEFILRGKLPDAAGPLWFKVMQTCDDGVSKSSNHWADIPATGSSTKGLKTPAALLEVVALQAPMTSAPAEHKH